MFLCSCLNLEKLQMQLFDVIVSPVKDVFVSLFTQNSVDSGL